MSRVPAADLILYWLSEHGSRSEASFAEGCRALELDAQDVLESLVRLGHVERVGTKVVIVPPTIIWAQQSGASRGLLYGARTDGFRDQLHERGVDIYVDVVAAEGPSVWSVAGDRVEIAAAIADLPMRFGVDRFDEVFAALPPLKHLADEFPEYGVSILGRSWRCFKPGTDELPVRAEDLLDVPGFYRSDEKPSQYVFRSPDGVLRQVRGRDLRCVARWTVVARECPELVLTHDASRSRLRVPQVGARLPVLLDRGLRIGTGTGPSFAKEGRGWRYDAVSSTRARQLARILGLRLRSGDVT